MSPGRGTGEARKRRLKARRLLRVRDTPHMATLAKEPCTFFRTKHLQFDAKPERPDPVFARMLQEPLGGQWGEMSVMITYLFQGWNCRGPQKYKDMIMDSGTEEIAHVEMLATMIARLLENSPVEA